MSTRDPIRPYPGVYRRKYRDRHGRVRHTDTFTISYYDGAGKRVREATDLTSGYKANQLRSDRIREVDHGAPSPTEQRKITLGDLRDLLLARYDREKQRSRFRVEIAFRHLVAFFGDDRPAISIGPLELTRYCEQRARKVSGPTMNRELSALRAAFNLAAKLNPPLISADRVPTFGMYAESHPRDGVLNRSEVAALVEALPEHHRGWVRLAAATGWRKSAVLTRTWSHVTTNSNGLRSLELDRRSSKNSKIYRVPVVGLCAQVVDAQREYVDLVERQTCQVVPWMFPYPDGRRINHPEDAFKRAARRAGLEGLVIHDLRRTAVKLMLDRGIAKSDIMDIGGWETDNVFERYALEDDGRKVAAMETLAGAFDVEPDRKVASMGERP